MRSLEDMLSQEPCILVEGAVIERLRRDPALSLDPQVLHAALVYDDRGRSILQRLYAEYLDIAERHDLPMVVLTPTWRASRLRAIRAGFTDVDALNRDCARFLVDLVLGRQAYAPRVCLGGLLGCKGDAYKPEEALAVEEARTFHTPQVNALAESGVDFLMAATLPALPEAQGIAAAMGDSGMPYVLSFVVRPSGVLLDGTPLAYAISEIDSAARRRPVGYMINCVHPTVFDSALAHVSDSAPGLWGRVVGFQANTSTLSPEELDGLGYLDTADPASFADEMVALHLRYGTRMLGGCCGTDGRHISAIAERMAPLCQRKTAGLSG